MDGDIFLPTLHWFAMKNSFSGSWKAMRFMIRPNVVMANAKEVDFQQSSLHAEYWHGEKCYELSKMEGEETFPMSDEGKAAMKAWLEAHI